ncbi:MAG: ABC transporter permease [Patescibacteria group bacterium]|jgi:putative ABC transport system permease protein
MNLLLLLKTSLKVLRANRRRTFLTVLGIIIGIASVIVVMSVGAGAQSLVLDQINSVGSNLIAVMPGYSDDDGPPASVFGITVTSLKHGDTEAIKKIPEIEAAASYVRGTETVQWGNKKTEATYVGTNSDYINVEKSQTIQGAFLDETHDSGINRVAVLGWQVWQDLFADTGENPIGQRIKIKRENFRVIGVMEKRGVQAFQNQDNLIFIPLETAQKLLLGINHVAMIRAKVTNENDVDFVMAQIEQILRERHDIKESQSSDFTVRATAQALDVLESVTSALTFFLSGIAAISLLVGGIGIMNIMLIAVQERIREIGLRKAIGAKNTDIQNQFLIESIILTLTGGIIGIIMGIIISGLVALTARYLGYSWNFVITISSIFLSVSVSSLVGIIFGWYPARKAAGFNPVEALRYE